MGKCKNIECKNETLNNRIYCCLKCRNVYVNKYLRDYSKIKKTLRSNHEDKYLKNPKYCKNNNCGKIIPYNKKRNKFCNRSCAAQYNNKNRQISEKSKLIANNKRRKKFYDKLLLNGKSIYKYCKNCKVQLKLGKKTVFCSKHCWESYKRKDLDKYKKYKLDCKFNFNLSDYPKEFDFSLIKKHGWYNMFLL